MTLSPPSPTVLRIAAALVFARFLGHALLLPAFEGPDEAFHLGRAYRLGLEAGADTTRVPAAVIDAVRMVPCPADLWRALGCPRFSEGDSHAIGNVVRLRDTIPPPSAPPPDVGNYERQQPPLYYLLTGAILAAGGDALRPPFRALIAVRVLSFFLVALGLVAAARIPAPPHARLMGLLLLLAPGAAEGLVRASNDSALFAWACLAMLGSARAWRGSTMALLCGVGVLLKLTAIVVVAAVAARLFFDGRRRAALGAAAVAAAAVVAWKCAGGGALTTYRWDTLSTLTQPVRSLLVGFAQSGWALVKTSLWLGGWSGFRPRGLALVLLVVAGLLALAPIVIALLGRRARAWRWHAVGFGVLSAGFVLFAVGTRLVFGIWGGVAGWYVWNWAPWLWQVALDAAEGGEPWPIAVIAGEAASLLALNAFWTAQALRAYG